MIITVEREGSDKPVCVVESSAATWPDTLRA